MGNNNKKRKRTAAEKKELNWKIAEIIWYSLGGIVLLGGLVFSLLGILIMNMDGNFTKHALYPLYKSQGEFISWLGFGSSYANIGLMLILISLVYFAIIFFIFSKRADIKERRNRQVKKSHKLLVDDAMASQVQTQNQTPNSMNNAQ